LSYTRGNGEVTRRASLLLSSDPSGSYPAPVVLTADEIVSRCRAGLDEHTPMLAVRDVLDELVADPVALDRALGPVELGGITAVHNRDDLTILRVAWTPGMALNPHEHRMWAVIGMYGGREDNAFYRRSPKGLEPAGGREVPAGDVLVLGDDVIHSVANTRREFAVALHVYGGDFFSGERSEWDFDTYEERPRDLARTRRLFDEANARWLEGA
jgi:predicted metal-dependent enzyme (double-stranded beta helix superfamily)